MKWILVLFMASVIDIGSGNGNSANAQAFFNRLLTPPTGLREALYGQVIDALASESIQLDGLLIFAATDNQTAFTNLITGGPQPIWPQLVGTFTADRGITTLGGSNNFDSLFIPSAGVNFTQNSACLFSWNLATADNPGFMIGSAGTHISPHFTDGHTAWAINCSTEDTGSNIAPDASGLWVANRTGATISSISRNGAVLATSARASTARDGSSLQASSANTCQMAVLGYGAGLTSGQLTALYNLLQVYLHGVGAV